MIATKEQERKALEKIRKTITDLGDWSGIVWVARLFRSACVRY